MNEIKREVINMLVALGLAFGISIPVTWVLFQFIVAPSWIQVLIVVVIVFPFYHYITKKLEIKEGE